MRLIDADKLIEDIYSNSYACTNDEVNEILNKQLETNIYVINNQPTAFDVDKVVEQLEDKKFRAFMTLANTGDKQLDMIYENVGNCIDDSIEIVKAGGRE